MSKRNEIKIVWGGKLEKDDRHHGQYQADRRGITLEQIMTAIQQPDKTIRQSSDCQRYFKVFESGEAVIVAVEIESSTYEVITCYWRN